MQRSYVFAGLGSWAEI